MPSSDQCLPEDCGEDVRKDGDDDEHHEGQDDQGGQAAADVLPTSTKNNFSKPQVASNFNLFTLTWSYGPPLGGTGAIFVDYHPRNLKTSLPASASSTHFVLHDDFFPL